MLATYAELKTALGNWLKRSDLNSYYDDVTYVAEKWIYRHARCAELEADLSLTVSAGEATLPTDYLAAKIVIWNGNPPTPLTPLGALNLYQKYPTRSSGVPKFYAVDKGALVFGPGVGNGDTITGTYYKNLGNVATVNHALFVAHPDLYLFASLAEFAPFLKNDARVEMWTAKRNAILVDVNGQAQNQRFGDGMITSVG